MDKILLIEQTSILKFRLEKLLGKIGFSEIITYSKNDFNFKKFLEKIGLINVAVIDYDQFKNSFELIIDEINEINKARELKIVVLVSKADTNEMMKFFKKGVDDVILKPFKDEVISNKFVCCEDEDNSVYVKKIIKGKDNTLCWCSDYEVGVEEIDSEHEDIIKHFLKLYDLMKEGNGHKYFLELIEFLNDYVHTHFEHEEKLHKKVSYVDWKSHKVLHDNFKKEVEKIVIRYSETDILNTDLIRLNLFIKEWLIQHILIEDKKVGKFIQENKSN